MHDQAEVLHATGRIDDDEIVFVRASNFLELRSWFGVGSGSRRAKPERAQLFMQADRVVVEAFADLHEARHLKSKFPAMSRGGTWRYPETVHIAAQENWASAQRRLHRQ